MLYNFDWLKPGQSFPPVREMPRVMRYCQNAQLFDGDHFADPAFRTHDLHQVDSINSSQLSAVDVSQNGGPCLR